MCMFPNLKRAQECYTEVNIFIIISFFFKCKHNKCLKAAWKCDSSIHSLFSSNNGSNNMTGFFFLMAHYVHRKLTLTYQRYEVQTRWPLG